MQQKGSLVDPDKTRFDFAHNAPMTDDEIRRVEAIVNARDPATTTRREARVMPIDEAQKAGAMVLFGEKYGDEVRVLDIGDARASCAAARTSRAPATSASSRSSCESGVAAGIRRVEAVTGDGALAWVQAQEAKLAAAAARAEGAVAEIEARDRADAWRTRASRREGARAAEGEAGASAQGDDLAAQAVDVKGVKVLAATLDGADVEGAARDDGQAEGQAEVARRSCWPRRPTARSR